MLQVLFVLLKVDLKINWTKLVNGTTCVLKTVLVNCKWATTNVQIQPCSVNFIEGVLNLPFLVVNQKHQQPQLQQRLNLVQPVR
uniref:Putative secreted protein n=1 Tax=Xenopsylla cheopis TaxID=163159 RepID=A0A6M2DZE1_XENCH